MKSLLFILPLLIATLLTGCNTIKGMGQDVQRAGSALERAAK